MPSMPKVRDSSGTIGTTWRPVRLSRSRVESTRTKAIVVETSRSPVPVSWDSKADSSGTGSDVGLAAPRRQRPAQRGTPLAQERHLRRVLRRAVEAHVADLLVGEGQAEAVAEGQQRVLGHLLLLVGDVLAFARLPHPVALDGLGEDHRRLAGVLDGRLVGGVDLARVQAAAVERPDLLVAHVGHHRPQLRAGPEEVLAHVGAVARLVGLVVAVDGLLHPRQQQAVVVARQQLVPARAPHHLDDVPARAPEHRLELLDDLPVAAHRAVQALQVAVDDEDEVVEPLAARQRDRAQRLGLVGLAVAQEGPDLAPRGVGDLAPCEVLHEPGLVDGHDRPEPHRDGRELPEVGHQPRMRVRRQPVARDLLSEALQLLLGQPPLEERAGVDARRRVALHVDEVAAVAVGGRAPEVVEADLVEDRRRLVARDVPAELGGFLVRLEHHRDRVPAHERAHAPLELLVDRVLGLVLWRDRVDVGRGAGRRRRRTRQLGVADDALEQMLGAVGSVVLHDGVERLEPLTRLLRVDVLLQHASLSPREAIGRSRVARAAVALRRILPARRPCESGGAGRSHVAEIKEIRCTARESVAARRLAARRGNAGVTRPSDREAAPCTDASTGPRGRADLVDTTCDTLAAIRVPREFRISRCEPDLLGGRAPSYLALLAKCGPIWRSHNPSDPGSSPGGPMELPANQDAPLVVRPECSTAHVADRVADAAVPHDDPLRRGSGGPGGHPATGWGWCRRDRRRWPVRPPPGVPRRRREVAAGRFRVLNMVFPFRVEAAEAAADVMRAVCGAWRAAHRDPRYGRAVPRAALPRHQGPTPARPRGRALPPHHPEDPRRSKRGVAVRARGATAATPTSATSGSACDW